MSNLALTIASKSGAEAGKVIVDFLNGFVFDISDDATKQIGETVAVADYRTGVEDAAVMGDDGYFGGDELSGVNVKLDKHLLSRVKCPIMDELNIQPSVWEGLGAELGKAVGKGIVKATLAKVTSVTVTNSANISAAYTEDDFVNLYSKAMEADIEPSESVLILNGKAMAYCIKHFAKASVMGGGDEIKQAYFANGLLGFARVVGSNLVPTGMVGLIAHKSAFVIAARPLPTDGSNDMYAIASDVTGFAYNLKKIVDPKFGTRYIVGEVNYGSNFSKAKIIRIVEVPVTDPDEGDDDESSSSSSGV